MYQRKNRITSLFNKKENTHTYPDGMIDHNVGFYGKEKIFAFSCYIYPDGIIQYSFTIYENNYNNYIWGKFNEE